MTTQHSLTVSVIANSVNVFPMSDSRTTFQMEIVVENTGATDIIPLKTEILVKSSFTWFTKPLESFVIVCPAPFWILKDKILKDTFHFSLSHSFSGSEQHSFCEIINETKELSETIKFDLIRFYLSDATVIPCPVRLIQTKPS